MSDQRPDLQPDLGPQDLLAYLIFNGPAPWTVDDLRRELDARATDLDDALADLDGFGLLRREGELVYPSRTAIHCARLLEGT